MNNRLEKLYIAMALAHLDAVALNPGPTLAYLTGLTFHLMERPVVMFFVPGKDPALVLPALEMLKVQELPYPADAFPYSEDPSTWDAAFQDAVKSLSLSGKKIGVEPRALRLLEFGYIQAVTPSSDFPDASEALGSLRLCKDPLEVQKMRRAVEIAEAALESIIPLIKIGISERELAAELTIQLLRHGSDPELPFAPIVSSGPNSANPHAAPSERLLQPGDLLVVDWGATFEGYISDLTRTFAIGPIDAELAKIHEIVQQANAAGRAAAKPGVPAGEVDRATRSVIAQAGYGEYFTHRTGHGIGIEAHEEPYMRGDNLQILQPGMTFTIEPGIYLPNRGGVRIEDNMLITENGAECLSRLARTLQIIEQVNHKGATKMKFGVLGSGMVGQAISARLVELGHDVIIGTRNAAKLAEWHTANPGVIIGSFEQTAAHGEILFNATSGDGSLSALTMAGEANLNGKILIDISNPLDYAQGFPPFLSVSNTDSLGEQIQSAFPAVKVVKSLNTITAKIMVYPREVANGDHQVFVSGNDADAKTQVIELLKSFGWINIMDLGDLSTARGTEMYLALWIRMYSMMQTSMFNIKIVK